MESPARSRLQHRMALLAALALFMFGVMSAPAAASDQVPTSSDGAEVENSSGPGSAPAEEPATTEEPASTEGSGSSDGPTSSGQSGGDPVTSEPTVVPEDDGQAPEEPVAEDSPTGEAPGETVPGPAPNKAAGDQPGAARAPQPKVTICHRTNSRTNPYNQIAVSVAGIVGPSGHDTHTGPIFAPGVEDWGDIIPPIPPELPDGLNWPEGQAILGNGCEVKPDVGPLPNASIGAAQCVGPDASVAVTVSNAADATAPAFFTILVDGVLVETVGPVARGQSETVVIPLPGQEDETFTVEVRSGGEVIASRVITVDCAPPPADVVISARLTCVGETATGRLTVANGGGNAVTVTATVDGAPVGTPLVVDPGTTETAEADLSAFEGQTITVEILVDGEVAATYIVTPDCVAPRAEPSVSVGGQVCPPPSATVTLGNTGDPDSQVVFVILVDGKVVQRSAPLFGGDTTTIVGDLSRFEDQTVVVELRANGEVLGSRTIRVNCVAVAGASASSGQPGSSSGGVLPGSSTGSGVLPAVGAGFGLSVIALGLGLLVVGSVLIAAGSRRSGSRSRQA